MASSNSGYHIGAGLKTKLSGTTIVDSFQAFLRWLDTNILPLIALPVLGVLAADDIRTHLTRVTPTGALAIGIVFAAILAVKSHK